MHSFILLNIAIRDGFAVFYSEIMISTVSSSRSWIGWISDCVSVIGDKLPAAQEPRALFRCWPVTYLPGWVTNNLTSSFQSAFLKGLPWLLKMIPVVIGDTTRMPQACFLLGLCWESVLEKSSIYFIMCAVYSVRFVFFACQGNKKKKKWQLTCPTSRYKPCSVWAASALIKYSITPPASPCM